VARGELEKLIDTIKAHIPLDMCCALRFVQVLCFKIRIGHVSYSELSLILFT
jgi:hypothetical protein